MDPSGPGGDAGVNRTWSDRAVCRARWHRSTCYRRWRLGVFLGHFLAGATHTKSVVAGAGNNEQETGACVFAAGGRRPVRSSPAGGAVLQGMAWYYTGRGIPAGWHA
jgi:hypothetical protein